jgi:hypothetical protein
MPRCPHAPEMMESLCPRQMCSEDFKECFISALRHTRLVFPHPPHELKHLILYNVFRYSITALLSASVK